jgi:GxxExxY protein
VTLLYPELVYKTVGAAMEVHRQLGPGFLETVYERALAYELSLGSIDFEGQAPLIVTYKGIRLGEYGADFVIEKKVTLEIKALVLLFIITMTYAPSAAASDARSEAAGDAVLSSRPNDNADEAAPPAPEGLAGM